MTLKEYYHFASETLSKAGFSHSLQEAKWLLSGALNQDPSFVTLNPSYDLSPQEEKMVNEWLNRRLEGEPLSRIRGYREFWSRPFYLNGHTLDPRPDTEILVEGILKWVGTRKTDPWSILDLGTGSGCILISLLHELPNAYGTGVDISENSLSMALENATLNGVKDRVHFCQSNWTQNLSGSFNIIVSNPPYIPLAQKDSLAKEVVSFDPHQALFGGKDGLDCYHHLAFHIKPFMAPQGIAVFEIGIGQRSAVEMLFKEAGFHILFVRSDLAGIERAIGFQC